MHFKKLLAKCWPFYSCPNISILLMLKPKYIRKTTSIPCLRADSRFAPNQWETSLQSNAPSHWLGANLESSPDVCCCPRFLHNKDSRSHVIDYVEYLGPYPLLKKWYRLSVPSQIWEWSGGWSTGMVDCLSASEQGQYLDGCPAVNTKCLVPLPFLPDLILWSTENRSHGSPVLVPPETQ